MKVMRMLDDVVSLIALTTAQDATGVWKTTESTPVEVFCQLGSIDRSEFFSAGRQGITPEYQLIVNECEYNGERLCLFRGTKYAIYRTYRNPDEDVVELYLQAKAGV